MAGEQPQPARLVEQVQGVVDVEIGPELAGGDRSPERGRAARPAVSEEPLAEGLGQRWGALGGRVGHQLADQFTVPGAQHTGDPAHLNADRLVGRLGQTVRDGVGQLDERVHNHRRLRRRPPVVRLLADDCGRRDLVDGDRARTELAR